MNVTHLKRPGIMDHESGNVEMAGPIFCDVFFSERLSLSFADLKVVMNRAVEEFCLTAFGDDVNIKIKFVDAYLKDRKAKVS